MNFRQKLYGRYDDSNQLMKISNNFYLYKNVNSISNRKIQYSLSPSRKSRINTENINQYYISKNNEIYRKMLENIRKQPVKININTDQKTIERMNNYHKKYKVIEDKLLAVENENFKKRLSKQKGRINAKNMDDEYQNYHLKEVKRLRKIPGEKTVVLPPISNILKERRVNSGKKRKTKNENERPPSAKSDSENKKNGKKVNNDETKEDVGETQE